MFTQIEYDMFILILCFQFRSPTFLLILFLEFIYFY